MFDLLPLNPTINPHFAARLAAGREPLYAKLPAAPFNGSPVPGLTSLYHSDEAGQYGSRSYPGNCGGNLIRDLLLYFKPSRLFDPMTGSGTCRDVACELGIDCVSGDIHDGFDACDRGNFIGDDRRFGGASFDFVWIHPPYWRQKLYAGDPRDLSRAKSLPEFLERYSILLKNCAHVLTSGGKLAVLMGDYCDREAGFIPLTYYTKQLAFQAGPAAALHRHRPL